MTDFQMKAIFTMFAKRLGSVQTIEDVKEIEEEMLTLARGTTGESKEKGDSRDKEK